MWGRGTGREQAGTSQDPPALPWRGRGLRMQTCAVWRDGPVALWGRNVHSNTAASTGRLDTAFPASSKGTWSSCLTPRSPSGTVFVPRWMVLCGRGGGPVDLGSRQLLHTPALSLPPAEVSCLGSENPGPGKVQEEPARSPVHGPCPLPGPGPPRGKRRSKQTPIHPRNPMGRTGLRGRGSLGWFGPNHTLQPVITR